LNRPAPEVGPKGLELLHELVPQATNIALPLAAAALFMDECTKDACEPKAVGSDG
jgi:hypothetical protein